MGDESLEWSGSRAALPFLHLKQCVVISSAPQRLRARTSGELRFVSRNLGASYERWDMSLTLQELFKQRAVELALADDRTERSRFKVFVHRDGYRDRAVF